MDHFRRISGAVRAAAVGAVVGLFLLSPGNSMAAGYDENKCVEDVCVWFHAANDDQQSKNDVHTLKTQFEEMLGSPTMRTRVLNGGHRYNKLILVLVVRGDPDTQEAWAYKNAPIMCIDMADPEAERGYMIGDQDARSAVIQQSFKASLAHEMEHIAGNQSEGMWENRVIRDELGMDVLRQNYCDFDPGLGQNVVRWQIVSTQKWATLLFDSFEGAGNKLCGDDSRVGGSVGGIQSLPDAEASPLETSNSPSPPYAVIASIAAGAVLLAAGRWYARRRRRAG